MSPRPRPLRDRSRGATPPTFNTGAADYIGASVALSGDGTTLAVGASGEASNATDTDGDQTNNAMSYAGAAYVR